MFESKLMNSDTSSYCLMTSLYIFDSNKSALVITLLYYCETIYRSRYLKFFVTAVFYCMFMKKINLEDILKSSGLEAIVICNQHSDNCGCHEDYRKAA